MIIQPNSKKSKITYILLIIGIGILIFMSIKSTFNKTEIEKEKFNESLQDSVEYWKDKSGRSNAKISLLESSNLSRLLELNSKDSTIYHLQQVAEEYKNKLDKPGSGVTTVDTETKGEATAVTEIEYNPQIDKYPIYRSSFNLGGWIFGSSVATKDSTTYDIAVKDKLDVIIGYEKQGFLGLGKPKPFAQVRSYNPYSIVKDFRSYRVSERKPVTIVIGPSIGYGLTGLQIGPFIGITITHPLIKIRL